MDADRHEELTAGPLRIGEWTYYPDLLRIERGSDKVKLEPLVGHLLYFFSHRASQTVTREELMVGVWPNRVVVDDALTGAIVKLRKALGDDRRNPAYLETIPKVGYRLIAPVAQLSLAHDEENGSGTGRRSVRSRWLIAFAVISILLLITLAIGLQKPVRETSGSEGIGEPSTPVSPVNPILLVLPFDDLSADGEQDYFADGIVEDVITDLSRIDKIRVLARSTSFRYKGKAVDPQKIARDLSLSHLVEGSVRRSGNNLRITARLVDTSNSQNLWSQRYDRKVADVFEVQADVAQNIALALSVNLTQEQRTRFGNPPTNSIEAYELFLKGRKSLSLRSPEANTQARDYYRQAILLDPDFARAYGAIAAALTRYANKGWTDTPDVERDLALHYAKKSVHLSPDSPYALWALGFTHLYRHENDQAAAAVQEALRIAPGYADGLALLALIYNYSARAEESIELINEAILINPLHSWDYLFNLGWAHYTLGSYEEAVRYQKLALERNEYATFARLVLVAAYMALDMPEEAAWQVEEILAYQTNMSIRFLEQQTPITLNNEKIRQYLAHLRAAGIPSD